MIAHRLIAATAKAHGGRGEGNNITREGARNRRHSATENLRRQKLPRIRLRADWIAVILALSATLPAMDDRRHRSCRKQAR
jgi:hypothetical protein